MRPGDRVVVRLRGTIEGVGHLERRLRGPIRDGEVLERWSVRFRDGELRSREIHPLDVVPDDDVLEQLLQEERELATDRYLARTRAGGAR